MVYWRSAGWRGQHAREVALAHSRRRNRVAGVVVARARIVDALIAEQEEGLVLAVVDFRDARRGPLKEPPQRLNRKSGRGVPALFRKKSLAQKLGRWKE